MPGAVVVTGAGGFIGHAMVEHLAAAGYDVRGLVRTLDADTAARREFVACGDLTTLPDDALRTLLGGARVVVHFAAQAHRPIDASDEAKVALRRINVDASGRVARAAAACGATHVVIASSVKVHGDSTMPGMPWRESDAPVPRDAYGESKWAAERMVDAVAEETGIRATALRLPLTYGPRAKGNFAALVRAVARGVPLPLASIDNRRSLLGTGNLASALRAVIDSDPGPDRGRLMPYFVADAHAVSTPELVRAIARALRVPARLWPLPLGALRVAAGYAGRGEALARLADSLEIDTTSFGARFGWTPPRTLEEGLAEAVAPL